ncbi:MAG: 3-ketoacyl-ACP reductase [Phycisphaerales bacterium]|nr:3-ketoacyl-ACP reductase [Phycisphaerales bacterium]
MSFSLNNKTAIVTGGSRGIGAGIAQSLGGAGANVIVVYNSNAGEAGKVVSAVTAAGGKAVAVAANVGESAAAKTLFDAAEKHFGKADILVHAAGAILYKKIEDTTDDDFDKLMKLNVYGTFYLLREAAKRLADGGRIITFSSTTTRLMLPTYGPYVATKGAVEQITRVAAKELGGRKITVNAVSPGATATDLFLTGKSQEQIDRNAAMTNFGRLGEVDDMTGLVTFLASDEARWITGQVIACNGGVA